MWFSMLRSTWAHQRPRVCWTKSWSLECWCRSFHYGVRPPTLRGLKHSEPIPEDLERPLQVHLLLEPGDLEPDSEYFGARPRAQIWPQASHVQLMVQEDLLCIAVDLNGNRGGNRLDQNIWQRDQRHEDKRWTQSRPSSRKALSLSSCPQPSDSLLLPTAEEKSNRGLASWRYGGGASKLSASYAIRSHYQALPIHRTCQDYPLQREEQVLAAQNRRRAQWLQHCPSEQPTDNKWQQYHPKPAQQDKSTS